MLPGTANTVELPGIHPLRNVKHVKLAPIPYLLALKFLWGIPTTTRSKLPLHSDPLLIASSNSGPTRPASLPSHPSHARPTGGATVFPGIWLVHFLCQFNSYISCNSNFTDKASFLLGLDQKPPLFLQICPTLRPACEVR